MNSGGTLDAFSIVEGHEYAETITDPQFTGWYNGPQSAAQENGDKCAWSNGFGEGSARNMPFSTGTFPVQSLWSNDDHTCVQQTPYWSSTVSIPNGTSGKPPFVFGVSCPANTSGETQYCFAAGDTQDALGTAGHGAVYRGTLVAGTGNAATGSSQQATTADSGGRNIACLARGHPPGHREAEFLVGPVDRDRARVCRAATSALGMPLTPSGDTTPYRLSYTEPGGSVSASYRVLSRRATPRRRRGGAPLYAPFRLDHD